MRRRLNRLIRQVRDRVAVHSGSGEARGALCSDASREAAELIDLAASAPRRGAWFDVDAVEAVAPFPLQRNSRPAEPNDTSNLAAQYKMLKQRLDRDAANLDVLGPADWIKVIRRFRFHR